MAWSLSSVTSCYAVSLCVSILLVLSLLPLILLQTTNLCVGRRFCLIWGNYISNVTKWQSGPHGAKIKPFAAWNSCYELDSALVSCAVSFQCECLCCQVLKMNVQLDQGAVCLPGLVIIPLTQRSSFLSPSPSAVSFLSIFLPLCFIISPLSHQSSPHSANLQCVSAAVVNDKPLCQILTFDEQNILCHPQTCIIEIRWLMVTRKGWFYVAYSPRVFLQFD